MKNITKYLLSFLLLISFISCNKIINPELDPNDPDFVVMNILVETSLRAESKYFVVIENQQTSPIFLTMTGNFGYVLSRGTKIVGSTINLHFVVIDELTEGTVDIKSFYEVPVGIDIHITDDNFKYSSRTNSIVNLSFENIPDFDIVSRTAKHAEQSFTQSTFETPATKPELGGETFESLQLFYACFQKGSTAAYKLERIPNVSNYTVDFSVLNSDLDKFSYSKNINDATISHADIQAWGNPFFYSVFVEIFNLNDFSIFPSSTFDIFVPRNDFELMYFVQNMTYSNSDYIYNNWFFSEEIITNMELLSGGLKTTSQTGKFPIIESEPDTYDVAEIRFESENFKWTLYGANASNFYIPAFPIDVIASFPDNMSLLQFIQGEDNGIVKLIDYSTFNGYEDVLSYQLNDTILKVESYYRTQEQVFSIK